jgi:hypothetical protein
MSYVLVGVLLLLIASGLITYLVLTATKRSSPAREEGGPPGIGTDQETPFGDTSEHAGEHDRGETVGKDDRRMEGAGEPTTPPPGRFQRDPVGGEAEARPFSEP